MELCSSPKTRIETRLSRMAADEAVKQPLPPGWETGGSQAGKTYYVKLATNERFDSSPAEMVCEEVKSFCGQALAESTMDHRIVLAREHLLAIRKAAEQEIALWSGPHIFTGQDSSETNELLYYYHTVKRYSVWHDPEEEWEAELYYRQKLLCILLRLEISNLPPLEWSSGKAINGPHDRVAGKDRVWKKPTHRASLGNAKDDHSETKHDALPVHRSSKISCRMVSLCFLIVIIIGNTVLLTVFETEYVFKYTGSSVTADMVGALKAAAEQWHGEEENEESVSETSSNPEVADTDKDPEDTDTAKKEKQVHAPVPSPPPWKPPPPQLKLFPLVQKLEFEEGGSIRVDPGLSVEVNPTSWTQPEWLRNCFSRVQLRLRRLAAMKPGKPVSGDLLLKNVKIMFAPSLTGVDALNERTVWNYNITCEANEFRLLAARTATCVVQSDGVYGSVAALQSTLLQLFSGSGVTPFRKIRIEDWPSYSVRGLMIDTGRRFVPKDMLLHGIIDAMALFRMNLLHLHLSDFCRFAVNLRGFPELNKSLVGISEGQYSVEEVREIVAYANERGIMVLPEIDLPGHASGLLPLEARGMRFCKPKDNSNVRPEFATKVHDDQQGKSRVVLTQLIKETFEIFNLSKSLNWFHVGGDEANPSGECTIANIVELESFVVRDIVGKKLGAAAVSWEELRFKLPDTNGIRAAGDTTDTIVIPWRMVDADQVMEKGHRAIAAYTINHYLDFSYKQSPVEMFWYQISGPRGRKGGTCNNPTFDTHKDKFLGGFAKEGLPPASFKSAKIECIKLGESCVGVTCAEGFQSCEPRKGNPYLAKSPTGEVSYIKNCSSKEEEIPDAHNEKLLGAISAMWTDNYCYRNQCGAVDPKMGAIPRGSVMYLRRYDDNFQTALGGMIWPRAAISAGSMWNYKKAVGTDMIMDIAKWISTLLRQNGIATCPASCTCDEISACGKPYPVIGNTGFDAQQHLLGCYTNKTEGSSHLNKLGPVASDLSWFQLREALMYCFWMGPHCVGVGNQTGNARYHVFAPPYRGARSITPEALFLKLNRPRCDPVVALEREHA